MLSRSAMHPTDGLKASIPPGRYTVELDPDNKVDTG
jgi:hypothetical protein